MGEGGALVRIARERDGAVVRVTLDRPERRNALSSATLGALGTALEEAGRDCATRVVVLAASGPVFSAGHDLSEMTGRTEEQYRTLFADCSQVMLAIRALPVPVIARVQGLATAAGCQLVAACDLAVAAEIASFATPGVKIGLFCTTPMIPLVRAIPAKPAMEMLLTGLPISAQRAYALGLINRVVPFDQLDAAINDFIEAILASRWSVLALGEGVSRPEWARRAEASPAGVTAGQQLEYDAQEGIARFSASKADVETSGSAQRSPDAPTLAAPAASEPPYAHDPGGGWHCYWGRSRRSLRGSIIWPELVFMRSARFADKAADTRAGAHDLLKEAEETSPRGGGQAAEMGRRRAPPARSIAA
ncbi:MAG: enoyl-CoA hydratase-related protein [Isosphaeraceae bacterium]